MEGGTVVVSYADEIDYPEPGYFGNEISGTSTTPSMPTQNKENTFDITIIGVIVVVIVAVSAIILMKNKKENRNEK